LEDLRCEEPVETVIPLSPASHCISDGSLGPVSVSSRNLIMNWIRPERSQETDWVGLFDRDFSHDRSFICRRGSSRGSTERDRIKQRKDRYPFKFRIIDEIECLLRLWVAYIRNDSIISLNCIKTRPHWMKKMRDTYVSCQ
ncbi:hypothetical protein TCAL_15233, partial [Tigriopus californicus]